MPSGTLKNWRAEGFGFILPDDGGRDIFAHARYFAPGIEPAAGMRLVYRVVQDERGIGNRERADNIRLES